MRVLRCIQLCCFFLSLPWYTSAVQAHGSVTAEDDLCIIRIGFYTAHFKIFQPDSSGNIEFCEDLPASGETIFVMEYLHKSLGEVPLEFRIVRNETGLGRFTRIADLPTGAELDRLTVYHQNPVIERDVFSARHAFLTDGDYLGVVTARHPQSEETFMAVFPFHVGKVDWGWVPLILLLAVLAQLGFWYTTGTLKRWYTRLLLCLPLLVWSTLDPEEAFAQEVWISDSGKYLVTYISETQPVPLNTMHQWVLHVETAAHEPVNNATLQLSGGMPAHDHGLPTEPVVTAALGNGDYRVEGLRFHMPGQWELVLLIEYEGSKDQARISLSL